MAHVGAQELHETERSCKADVRADTTFTWVKEMIRTLNGEDADDLLQRRFQCVK